MKNYLAVQFWRYLKGQLLTHTIQGEDKHEYDTLVALRLDAIAKLFSWWEITDKRQQRNLFIKLFEINELVNNKVGLDEFKKEKKKSGFNNFLGQLMKRK